ncbi:MAG TPA: hypothetical protein VLK37_04660 [Solirubrobacterales bacterium]|nr:hypothetical protein [Solirubrobacterales bacterium]
MVTARPHEHGPLPHRSRPWLTWWKLSIIAFVCGGCSFASGLLAGASAPLLWISTSAGMGLGILFLVVELLTKESRPTLGIGGDAPKTNQWRTRIAIFPLVLIMIISLTQAAVKFWPAGGGSGGSVYVYPPPGDGQACEPGQPYGSPD